MFENDTKGWYGSYSTAGRESAEKYHIVIHKKEILQNEHKKLKIRDLFTPDEPEEIQTLDDQFDIYKSYSSDKDNQKTQFLHSNNISKPKKKKKIKNDKFTYHNKHINDEKRKKKPSGPISTSYFPRYEYIWPKLITGPSWNNLKGRNDKKKEIDKKNFFNEDITFLPTSKCLVNMNKTTQRGDITVCNNVRIRNDKRFNLTERFDNKKRKKIQNLKLSHNKNKSLNEINNQKTLSQNKTNSNLHTINKTNSNNNIIDKSNTINNETISKRNNSTFYSRKEISVPDFQKTLSREQREKVKALRIINTHFISPDYSQVRERIITMTKYNKPKKYIPRIKKMEGFDSGITFDIDSIYNKIDNHTEIKTPNFKLMTSRIDKKNSKLPTYMQNIFDRKSIDVITEKSLQLNNYSQGKFMSPSTSFFPKRSYNNIINLNLLNYENLTGRNIKDDVLESQKEQLKSSINFYNKNYEELIKEGGLNKFDNITYKTIHQRRKIDPNDMEKFLINFDNIDA